MTCEASGPQNGCLLYTSGMFHADCGKQIFIADQPGRYAGSAVTVPDRVGQESR